MTSISLDDARHVARLARLHMDDEQLATMASELDMILDSIGKIAELDLEGVEPTTHADASLVNVLGDDVPHESLATELALANAPDSVDGCFRVPRMSS